MRPRSGPGLSVGSLPSNSDACRQPSPVMNRMQDAKVHREAMKQKESGTGWEIVLTGLGP